MDRTRWTEEADRGRRLGREVERKKPLTLGSDYGFTFTVCGGRRSSHPFIGPSWTVTSGPIQLWAQESHLGSSSAMIDVRIISDYPADPIAGLPVRKSTRSHQRQAVTKSDK